MHLISVKNEIIIQNSIILNPNLSNYFNSTINISFSLLKTELVPLTIYFLLREKIAALLKELISVESYQVSSDADGLASVEFLLKNTTRLFHSNKEVGLDKIIYNLSNTLFFNNVKKLKRIMCDLKI